MARRTYPSHGGRAAAVGGRGGGGGGRVAAARHGGRRAGGTDAPAAVGARWRGESKGRGGGWEQRGWGATRGLARTRRWRQAAV